VLLRRNSRLWTAAGWPRKMYVGCNGGRRVVAVVMTYLQLYAGVVGDEHDRASSYPT